ncbi:MAG: hypothetical protein IKK22_05790 [Firmicutes bacterium]|nr:hypothetical protein [Bacillota bacterium]
MSGEQSIHKENHHLLEQPIHIGMRKAKSVLAVFVGFCLWQMIRLAIPGLEVHPIYIYIYGIIEMRETSDKTINFGLRRIKATFTAIIVGLPLLILSAHIQQMMTNETLIILVQLVTILIGVTLALVAADSVGCKNFCGLAAAIVVILIVSHSYDEPILYSCLRASETILGVFVAWLINVKWFPYTGKPAATAPAATPAETPAEQTK